MKAKTFLYFFKFIALTFFTFINSANSFVPQITKTRKISYSGQTSAVLELKKSVKKTRYKSVQKDSTCTRKIPYTTNVCKDETRYRQECSIIPGSRQCRMVNEQVCNYETRYRQKCERGPSQRVCRPRTGRIQVTCVARDQGHEEHWGGHKAYGYNVANVSQRAKRECESVHGGCSVSCERDDTICEDRPGRRTCRQEAYQERVCHYEQRNRCEDIPEKRVCNQVPYQQNVCRDVTKYRTESYACKKTVKVPYEVQRTIKAYINIAFVSKNDLKDTSIDFKFTLLDNGEIKTTLLKEDQLSTYIFIQKDLEKEVSDLTTLTTGEIELEMQNKDSYLSAFNHELKISDFGKKYLTLELGQIKKISDYKFELVIMKKNKEIYDGMLTLDSMSLEHDAQKSYITVDFRELGFKLKGKLRKYNIKLKMSLKQFDANLLNSWEDVAASVVKESF